MKRKLKLWCSTIPPISKEQYIKSETTKDVLLSTYSQTSVPSNLDGSNLFESPVNFPYISKLNPLSLEHRYLEQSNSINGPVNNKITSFTMPNSNIAILFDRCTLRLNVLTAKCDKCRISDRSSLFS
jgi:hypothetical protein